MKVLAAVISAAATAQSLEDRGSATAWTSIEASYNSLYDAILAAYSTTNIPGVKKANRLRDFLNKVDNFPTRVSDSCANFAGSGDPNAFVFPNYDENDICHSLNNLISSLMSFHDAFVCMDGVNLTTHNGWAPHKMRRLIHRQRHILFNRKFKQLKCNLPLAPTPAPCESDPCDGLESCETIVNGCSLFPVRNNLVSTVQTALDYKFSAEVLCNSVPDGNWQNIFHVSRNGGDVESVGDRTFGLFQKPDGHLHLTVNDPTLSQYQRYDEFPCTSGEWATYSVEVRQISGSGNVEYVSKIGDTPLHTSQYSAAALPAGLDLQVHIADDHYDAATSYSVRNFYYQTFHPCPSRTDPCLDLDSCSTVVDSCEFNPVVGSQKTVLSAARNYKVSADILCPDINEWKYNIHLSGNGDPYATPTNAGDRQFSVITSPDSGSMEISLTDPSAWDKRQSFMQPCTIGEWNTYSLEVNQVDEDPSTLRWVFNFDGTQAAQGTYDLSGAYSSGDLNAFVFDLIPNSVRNFSYQTFDDICLLKNEQVFTIRARTSSSVSHAQTDGTVNFQIPKAGCDTWFTLDDPNQPDDREPGQIDTYVIDVSSLPASCLENLGDIRILESDDDGWYPDWFEVTVVDKTACTTTVYSYEGLQWVDFGETSYSQNAAPVVTQS